MKLWFFEADPETGLIHAGYVTGGKAYKSLVRSQAGQLYVVSGSRVKGDLRRHDFTPSQTDAFKRFEQGDRLRVDYGVW